MELISVVTKLDANGTTVMAGGRANLTCEVTGDPIPEIDWYRDGMEAPYYNQESLNVVGICTSEVFQNHATVYM